MKKYILIISILITIIISCSVGNRKNLTENKPIQKDTLLFLDTMFNIVTDSFANNMGRVTSFDKRLIKYFKYIGNDTVSIVRTWTGDPHFICEYPHEPLIKNQIYSIEICFSFTGNKGTFNKTMGFNLTNGDIIIFRFKGEIVPTEIK